MLAIIEMLEMVMAVEIVLVEIVKKVIVEIVKV